MSTIHQFYATEKMYKDKFKQWKWSKNLSRDIAMGMLNKAKQRQPKQTVFQRGNQTWTTDQIMKKHGKFANYSDLHTLENYPTPQGVTWKTPGVIQINDSPTPPEKPQDYGIGHRPAYENAAGYLDGSTDQGPFQKSMKQSSIAHVTSIVKAALNADKEGNEEQAILGLKDALSCSSRLLSPTDAETTRIAYLLASYYATKKRMAEADDTLNWMTNQHRTGFGAGHAKTMAHMLVVLHFLRRWKRNEDADSLIYRLLESQQNPEMYPVILQNSTRPDAVSEEMIGDLIRDLLIADNEVKITSFMNILEDLANESENHGLLGRIMPRIVGSLDDYQQTHDKLVIQARCILAEILAKSAQYEQARSILRGSGRCLKQQVDIKSSMRLSTLKLVQRVAFTFFEAGDVETCDKVLERLTAVIDTKLGIEPDRSYYMAVTDFFISTASGFQKRCNWERSRPWVEQALALSQVAFGEHSKLSKQIEEILETRNIQNSWAPKAELEGFLDNIGRRMVIKLYGSDDTIKPYQ